MQNEFSGSLEIVTGEGDAGCVESQVYEPQRARSYTTEIVDAELLFRSGSGQFRFFGLVTFLG